MAKSFRWDERRNIVIPGDKNTTIEFCVKHFLYCASEAIKHHDKFFVALSGGSTPKAIYDLLASDYSGALDWNKVYVFWSDERSVAPDHPDSNYHMAMNCGFSKLPIPSKQIFRMQAEDHLKENAALYEQTIGKTLLGHAFDLIMLGMGEDGHTASLFPNTKGLEDKNHLVIPNYIPQKDTWRMTMTFKCINNASNVVLYVIGDSKKETLKKVFKEKDPSLLAPSCKVGTKEHPALWIVDKDASADILPLLK
jgi:6-phosphogluconolactonase